MNLIHLIYPPNIGNPGFHGLSSYKRNIQIKFANNTTIVSTTLNLCSLLKVFSSPKSLAEFVAGIIE
jgi:hypothetical protein